MVNSRHSVAAKKGRAAKTGSVVARSGIALGLLGAGAGLWFTALFVGGDPRVFAFDWLGLMALLAGIGAAVLFGHSRGQVARSTTIALLAVLAVWTAIAAL
jgi:hypothetical protein